MDIDSDRLHARQDGRRGASLDYKAQGLRKMWDAYRYRIEADLKCLEDALMQNTSAFVPDCERGCRRSARALRIIRVWKYLR